MNGTDPLWRRNQRYQNLLELSGKVGWLRSEAAVRYGESPGGALFICTYARPVLHSRKPVLEENGKVLLYFTMTIMN